MREIDSGRWGLCRFFAREVNVRLLGAIKGAAALLWRQQKIHFKGRRT